MANRIIFNLDTSKSQYNIYECKQNDDLILEANIFENGIEKDITNKEIIINCTRADETFVIQNTNITKANNKIIANLKRDFTRVDGLDKLEIVLTENEKQSTTFDFNILVKPSVLKTATEESKDTITIIEELNNIVLKAKQTKAETEQLISTGSVATKGDIALINSSLDTITVWSQESSHQINAFKKQVSEINRRIQVGTVEIVNNIVDNGYFRTSEPFVLVSLDFSQVDTNYIVTTQIVGDAFGVGDIIVYDKALNGFKIKYTGSQSKVNVAYHIVKEILY